MAPLTSLPKPPTNASARYAKRPVLLQRNAGLCRTTGYDKPRDGRAYWCAWRNLARPLCIKPGRPNHNQAFCSQGSALTPESQLRDDAPQHCATISEPRVPDPGWASNVDPAPRGHCQLVHPADCRVSPVIAPASPRHFSPSFPSCYLSAPHNSTATQLAGRASSIITRASEVCTTSRVPRQMRGSF